MRTCMAAGVGQFNPVVLPSIAERERETERGRERGRKCRHLSDRLKPVGSGFLFHLKKGREEKRRQRELDFGWCESLLPYVCVYLCVCVLCV